MVSQINTKILLIFLSFLVVSSLLFADKVNDTYQQMLKSYAKLSSWQSVINQTNYFSQTKTSLKSSGNFYYEKGRIAIRYNKPNEQIMVVQKGEVTMYDKASNTALKSKLVSSVQSLNPVEIVKTYWQKSDKKLLKSVDNSTVLSIKPISDAQIKEIKVNIDSGTGYIAKLVYTDKQDNTVTITFSKMRINKPISAAVWKLNIPANAIIH